MERKVEFTVKKCGTDTYRDERGVVKEWIIKKENREDKAYAIIENSYGMCFVRPVEQIRFIEEHNKNKTFISLRKCKMMSGIKEPRKALYEGRFHQWGLDNAGDGEYSVGIIERDDGTIKMVYAECIMFIDPIEDSNKE